MIRTAKISFVIADPCYKYQNLSEADRKISYLTPINLELCDNLLTEGWYRFVGAAETKMLTTRVPAVQSGWLDGAHPTVEDGEVSRTVCLSEFYRLQIFKHNFS